MRSTLVRLALLAVSLLGSSLAPAQTIQAVAQSARIQNQVQPQVLASLHHHVPAYALASAALPSTALDPSTPISGVVVLLSRAPQVEAAFEQLLAAQLDPNSPRYHQWLIPQQVGTLYGPAQSDVDAVTAWLTSAGLTVTSVSPSRLQITVNGSVQALSATFATSFRTFALANGESRYSITQEPSVPAALAPVVGSIAGLSQVVHHTSARHSTPIALQTGSASSSGVKPQVTATDGEHFMLNSDFNIAFDVNAALSSGYTGAGQRIAIAGLARINPADTAAVQTLSGESTSSINTIIPPTGVDPGAAKTTYSASNSDNGNQDEATIDVDRSAGTATGAGIDLVASGDIAPANTYATQGLFIAISYEINTLNDPILNISFGGCEALNGQSNTLYEDSLFQQAAAEGITTFVSSGDSGAAGCNFNYTTIPATQQLSINDLCASSYVTCVGGTEFADFANPASYWSGTNNTSNYSSILSYIPEGAWNEVTAPSGTTTTYTYGSTGGGVSVYIAKPSWQVGTGVLPGSFREVPDLSFPASTHDGFLTCLNYLLSPCPNGGFFSFGGTSVAAPSMAGVQAIANQKLNSRQGNINPYVYALAAISTNVFHDATVASSAVSGCALTTPSMCNNSTPAAASLTGGQQGYALTAGWDAVTGWGSLDVNNFVSSVASVEPHFALAPATASVTLASASSASSTDAITISSSATATASAFTGTVNLSCAVKLASGATAAVSPTCTINAASVTFPATSSATVTLGTVAPHSVPGHSSALLAIEKGGSLAFAGLLLFTLPLTRRRGNWSALAVVLLLAGSLLGLSGCGSSSSTSGGGTTLSGGTTTGAYTVTITGTSIGSPAASTTIALTVN
jgi:pseudomonalisin